jgi:hypothetical protein
LRWWEFDLTRYVIWTLEKCGLAWKVVWPAKETKNSDTVSAESAGALLLTSAKAKNSI